MTDLELMQEIRSQWQPQLAAAVEGTKIPEAFLAAIVANESGGGAVAERYEKNVMTELIEVIVGRKDKFAHPIGTIGTIPRSALVNYIAGFQTTPITAPTTLPANAFQRVEELATSWGLTQIMGYHVLEWLVIPNFIRTVDELRDGARNLVAAVHLLIIFANEFGLDLSSDFSELLHCWNGGHPTAPTFDPAYTPNGINRMDLYRSLSGS